MGIDMLTADLPLEEKLKALITNIESDILTKIAKGCDVRGTSYYAIRAGEIIDQIQEEQLPEVLVQLNADHLLLLLVENNKGEDFNGGGTINIHVYSAKHSFEGYTDLYLNEEGARVVSPMEWQAFEGSMGYFK